MNTRGLLEAILFVAEEPVAAPELAQVLEVPVAQVVDELTAWARDLEQRHAGFVLREIAGGWRLYSNPGAAAYLERFAASPGASRLSQAALETLAVVAYRQPVSRGQVSEIRGVDCERTMRTLERYGLIAEVGIAPGPGSPILYGSTELFLEKLGLNRLSDLPPLAEHVPPADVVEALERPFRPEASSSESTN